MATQENFLHTTHRTVSWFNKASERDELELASPFQRNPVWTDIQKAYLIDTILLSLPVPELYMVDAVDDAGDEQHIVVDGQQRIRACLDFISGDYRLLGDDVNSAWRGLLFEELPPDQKQSIFSYKFVVRILPLMPEEEIRRIFSRLNRNVVALNEQELRNATYWGPFIKCIQTMADEDQFWSESGIFSANDHRRMLDHEFISELAIAHLHGPQNKKDKLDYYYQMHESFFEEQAELKAIFAKVTAELTQILPEIKETRWRKKSDFYTLFLILSEREKELPFSSDHRQVLGQNLRRFGEEVSALSRLEEDQWSDPSPHTVSYLRAVARAASDKANRIMRDRSLRDYLFGAS